MTNNEEQQEEQATLNIKQKAMFILGNNYDKLDNETKESINILYESCVIKALTKYRWGFSRRVDKLEGEELNNNDNNNKYKYSFILPNNFLTLINIYNDKQETNINNDYNLIDKLYTNNKTIYIKYIKRINTYLFPSTFTEYLIYELASELCYNLTGDYNLLQILEQKKREKYEIATNIDARQRRPYVPLYNPFSEVRG